MKTPCPRCGRSTVIEEEVGDFPTRCGRCGAFLRRRSKTAAGDAPARSAGAARRGARPDALAGLLTRTARPRQDLMMAAGGAAAGTCAKPRTGILRPESRREIARAHARQQAIERANLRGNHQALGALTWAGMILAVLLGIGAAVLKAQALWQHPTPARADVVRLE